MCARVCVCVCDLTSHGRTGLLHNYRTPAEVILAKTVLTQRIGWPIAEPTKKIMTMTTRKRFKHETVRGKVEVMTLHLAASAMFSKVLRFVYGEESFHIEVLNKCKLLN
jgi:hypothetical protein